MGSADDQRTAIVVGAGVGGVVTAARLAKEGYRVKVYEKNSYTGGRCSLIHWKGYRFDRGPSLLLLPDQFMSTFTDLGTSFGAEGLKLFQCEPNYRLYFHDNEQMELSTSLATMKREVERYEGKDGFSRYLNFLRDAHNHYELSVSHVLSRPFPSLLSLLRLSFLIHVFRMHPFASLYSRASRYFHSERLRRAFTFSSMYMGMSPFQAPATYSLLQYTELAEGVWYPRGGFHAIIDALVRVGERLGVSYHLSSPVNCVTIDSATNRANGIILTSGERISADIVIVNADLITSYSQILPQNPSVASYAKRLRSKRTSCSSISFYWALSCSIAELHTHNIFLAEHYAESFDRIFEDHAIPSDPSFYVNVPSRIDPSAAPEGKDSVVVLVPCGHLPSPDEPDTETPPAKLREKWTALVKDIKDKVLETICSRTGVDLEPLIAYEQVSTPVDWKDELNLDRGAILGLSHDFFNVLAFRPKMKAECGIQGLWFVGASTHPGTGVPIVLAGSRVLVNEIKKLEGDGFGKRPRNDGLFDWISREWHLGSGTGMKVGTKQGFLGKLDRMDGDRKLSGSFMLLLLLFGLISCWLLPLMDLQVFSQGFTF